VRRPALGRSFLTLAPEDRLIVVLLGLEELVRVCRQLSALALGRIEHRRGLTLASLGRFESRAARLDCMSSGSLGC
jgi:hypothetical protein